MKCFFVFINLLVWSFFVDAQSLERSVIATGGDFLINGVSLSQTIGEQVGETFYTESIHLTQGFQQGVLELSVLPIELLAFSATRLNKKEVQVEWIVNDYKEVESITLERKKESETDFETIAQWPFEDKASWNFLDNNDFAKESYYRLKIKNLDGLIQYSKIEVVRGVPITNLVNVSPNPFVDAIHIEINSDARLANETIELSLYDNLGILILRRSFKNNLEQTLNITDLSSLNPGNYQLIISIAEHTEAISIIKS